MESTTPPILAKTTKLKIPPRTDSLQDDEEAIPAAPLSESKELDKNAILSSKDSHSQLSLSCDVTSGINADIDEQPLNLVASPIQSPTATLEMLSESSASRFSFANFTNLKQSKFAHYGPELMNNIKGISHISVFKSPWPKKYTHDQQQENTQSETDFSDQENQDEGTKTLESIHQPIRNLIQTPFFVAKGLSKLKALARRDDPENHTSGSEDFLTSDAETASCTDTHVAAHDLAANLDSQPAQSSAGVDANPPEISQHVNPAKHHLSRSVSENLPPSDTFSPTMHHSASVPGHLDEMIKPSSNSETSRTPIFLISSLSGKQLMPTIESNKTDELKLAFKRAKESIEAKNSVLISPEDVAQLHQSGLTEMKKLVGQQYADAQHYMGKIYLSEKQYSLAYSHFTSASKQSHAAALYDLGHCYEFGFGTSKSHRKALERYKTASVLGEKRAYYRLGLAYFKGDLDCVKQNTTEGVKWLKRGVVDAGLESGELLMFLQDIYERGNGVKVDIRYSQDILIQAAELEYPPALMKLGSCLEFGKLGFAVNLAAAFEWYMKAAQINIPEAQFIVSAYYMKGLGNIAVSEKQAYYWMRVAAEHGYPKAQYGLGIFTLQGIGCEAAPGIAQHWIDKAAQNGDNDALKYINSMPAQEQAPSYDYYLSS